MERGLECWGVGEQIVIRGDVWRDEYHGGVLIVGHGGCPYEGGQSICSKLFDTQTRKHANTPTRQHAKRFPLPISPKRLLARDHGIGRVRRGCRPSATKPGGERQAFRRVSGYRISKFEIHRTDAMEVCRSSAMKRLRGSSGIPRRKRRDSERGREVERDREREG